MNNTTTHNRDADELEVTPHSLPIPKNFPRRGNRKYTSSKSASTSHTAAKAALLDGDKESRYLYALENGCRTVINEGLRERQKQSYRREKASKRKTTHGVFSSESGLDFGLLLDESIGKFVVRKHEKCTDNDSREKNADGNNDGYRARSVPSRRKDIPPTGEESAPSDASPQMQKLSTLNTNALTPTRTTRTTLTIPERRRTRKTTDPRMVSIITTTDPGLGKVEGSSAAAFTASTTSSTPAFGGEWSHIFSHSSTSVLMPPCGTLNTDVQWDTKKSKKGPGLRTTQITQGKKLAREPVAKSSSLGSVKLSEPGSMRGLLDEDEGQGRVSLLGLETDSSSDDTDSESKSNIIDSSSRISNSGVTDCGDDDGENNGENDNNNRKSNRRHSSHHAEVSVEFVQEESRIDRLRNILHAQEASENESDHSHVASENKCSVELTKGRKSVAFGREEVTNLPSVPTVNSTNSSKRGEDGRYYPMWLMPLADVMDIDVVEPHQVYLERQTLVKYEDIPKESTIFFISHQWLSFIHPDPFGEQIRVLQSALKKLSTGEKAVRPQFRESMVTGTAQDRVIKEEWTSLLTSKTYIWYDYISMPQVTFDPSAKLDLEIAVSSIQSYVDASHVFIVLCPPIPHHDLVQRSHDVPRASQHDSALTRGASFECRSPVAKDCFDRCVHERARSFMTKHKMNDPRLMVSNGSLQSTISMDNLPLMCDFDSWNTRGWCLLENFAMHFNILHVPQVVIQSEEHIFLMNPRPVLVQKMGHSLFSCCAAHEALRYTAKPSDNIPKEHVCDKGRVRELVSIIIANRLNAELENCRAERRGKGLNLYRLIRAMRGYFFEGFSMPEDFSFTAAETRSLDAFLAAYGFTHALENFDGWTPLRCAALSANVKMVKVLTGLGARDDTPLSGDGCALAWGTFENLSIINHTAMFSYCEDHREVLTLLYTRAKSCVEIRDNFDIFTCSVFRGTAGYNPAAEWVLDTFPDWDVMSYGATFWEGHGGFFIVEASDSYSSNFSTLKKLIAKSNIDLLDHHKYFDFDMFTACVAISNSSDLTVLSYMHKNMLRCCPDYDINRKHHTQKLNLLQILAKVTAESYGLLEAKEWHRYVLSLQGATVLHIAASLGKLRVCAWLLDHGALPHIANDEGKLPGDIAKEQGYAYIVALFDHYDRVKTENYNSMVSPRGVIYRSLSDELGSEDTLNSDSQSIVPEMVNTNMMSKSFSYKSNRMAHQSSLIGGDQLTHHNSLIGGTEDGKEALREVLHNISSNRRAKSFTNLSPFSKGTIRSTSKEKLAAWPEE